MQTVALAGLNVFCTATLCGCRLQVQGSGFMYKQVRHMAGALLSVGQGKLQLSFLQKLLDIGNSQPPGTWVYVCVGGGAGLCECLCDCVMCYRHAGGCVRV